MQRSYEKVITCRSLSRIGKFTDIAMHLLLAQDPSAQDSPTQHVLLSTEARHSDMRAMLPTKLLPLRTSLNFFSNTTVFHYLRLEVLESILIVFSLFTFHLLLPSKFPLWIFSQLLAPNWVHFLWVNLIPSELATLVPTTSNPLHNYFLRYSLVQARFLLKALSCSPLPLGKRKINLKQRSLVFLYLAPISLFRGIS